MPDSPTRDEAQRRLEEFSGASDLEIADAVRIGAGLLGGPMAQEAWEKRERLLRTVRGLLQCGPEPPAE